MHRSRLPLLVIVAVLAACSTQENSEGSKTLSQDSTLAARISVDQKTDKLPFPDACGAAVSVPDQPTATNRTQAEELARQAYHAEMLGNVREAASLLRRASELDWTDKSAAYHLGRISEALGDQTVAMSTYCRYLALAPATAESAEVRERIAKLSRSQTHVAAGVIDSLPSSKAASAVTAARATSKKPNPAKREKLTPEPQGVARASVAQSARALPPKDSVPAARAVADATDGVPTARDSVTSASETGSRADSGMVATPRPVPPIASPNANRGPSQAKGAGIGAVAGAIIGAATGRSVKAAAIGAAAGGILGTVAVRGSRPARRGNGW